MPLAIASTLSARFRSSASTDVAYWPIATDRILVADRRFRGITDMAGAAAGWTRTRLAQICRCWLDVDLFRYCEGIIYLDPEVPDGAFDLGVAEQELHSS